MGRSSAKSCHLVHMPISRHLRGQREHADMRQIYIKIRVGSCTMVVPTYVIRLRYELESARLEISICRSWSTSNRSANSFRMWGTFRSVISAYRRNESKIATRPTEAIATSLILATASLNALFSNPRTKPGHSSPTDRASPRIAFAAPSRSLQPLSTSWSHAFDNPSITLPVATIPPSSTPRNAPTNTSTLSTARIRTVSSSDPNASNHTSIKSLRALFGPTILASSPKLAAIVRRTFTSLLVARSEYTPRKVSHLSLPNVSDTAG